MSDPIRVLIVDDSRIFRGIAEEALGGLPELRIVGSVWNGVKALEFLHTQPVDVLTLDVEMPEMDGLQTLAELRRVPTALPTPAVILVSSLTTRGAAVTVAGLEAGAFDFVTKPSGSDRAGSVDQLRRELLPRITAAARRVQRTAAARPAEPSRTLPVVAPVVAPVGAPVGAPATPPRPRVRAVLIGVSTGGPAALATLLPELSRRVSVPVLIVQHMPADFTKSLAESLAKKCPGREVLEAADGTELSDSTIVVAPGDRHLMLRTGPTGRLVAGLNDQPKVNGFRPSVDVLFRSAATVVGRDCVAVVLTGMGSDGTAGVGPLKRAGARVLVQDEASSIVWGMPGSVVAAGLADQIVPLHRMAEAVAQAVLAG